MKPGQPKVKPLPFSLCAVSLLALPTLGCESDGNTRYGQLDIVVQARSVNGPGLATGIAPAQMSDGWIISFTHYLAAIGHVGLSYASDPTQSVGDTRVFLMDLATLTDPGILQSSLQLAEGLWNFQYQSALSTPQAQLPEPVGTQGSLYQQMIANQWTYQVQGMMRKRDGRSCPPRDLARPVEGAVSIGQTLTGTPCYAASELSFQLGARAPTQFGPCQADGLGGVLVVAGSTTSAAITIEGDRIFAPGFSDLAAGGAIRNSQWLADCDLNLDGLVTQEELRIIPISALESLGPDLALERSPIQPLVTMYDYLRAQFKMQGRFQGLGQCTVDGTGIHANQVIPGQGR